MRIDSLCIEGFRNIKKMRFEPCAGTNVIYGGNAQGKTNLLEAVWLFTGAKSFRGAKDIEYICFGEEKASLELNFFADGREQTADIDLSCERKMARLNEIKQERISKLAGRFCAVVFSPDHLSMVKDGPETRRRMIDTSLCQAYPKYAGVLGSYERALKQRNRLLKDIPAHASLVDTLDVWDRGIIEYGAYITHARARYVVKLARFASEIYDGISMGKEKMGVAYAPSFGGDVENLSRQDLHAGLEQAVRESRADDIRLGTTTMGPHRDDVDIDISGVSARAFGSQGQQRSCVLALKLAECRILEEGCGEPPVVLLDDVMSELDESRREYLLNRLTGRQVLITCCDAGDIGGLDDGRVFNIENGSLL